MKRAQSDLIAAFLLNVQKGHITGKDNTSGPVMLERMTEALRAIVTGTDPDTALQITRAAGAPPDPINGALAFLIHQRRKAGDTWLAIQTQANDWLAENDRKRVSERWLREIYKQHRDSLEAFDKIKRMQHLTEEAKKSE